MKANDYAELARAWIKNPPAVAEFYPDAPEITKDQKCDLLDLQCEIVRRLFVEVKEIAAMRKATRPEALGAIMNELKQKWFAICKRLDTGDTKGLFSRDTFMALVRVYDQEGSAMFVAKKGLKSA